MGLYFSFIHRSDPSGDKTKAISSEKRYSHTISMTPVLLFWGLNREIEIYIKILKEQQPKMTVT
jgi:hypothetical protein